MDLTERKLESSLAYRGHFFNVMKDTVRLPDGATSQREYVTHPGAVAVFAVLPDGRLVFERQYRYPVGRALLEIPAGKIDPDESPLATARRELKEETGYTASDWWQLPVAYPCIGYSNERIVYFVAEGLSLGARELDQGEFLDVLPLALEEVRRLAASGELCDSKTLTGLYWFEQFLDGTLARERAV
ncbi:MULTISPECIES: NUDIX domain-containing protein [Microvirgula]|uniref:GDP-mannose pyrophosphatase n=1 Tax=Microvirgula aerodenitrificans TaxID=57480 RepID=A0A2U3TH34_9NEIS|nr:MULTISPECIES: NUDIX hydrolase [Microvirgula]AVY92711.1 NUDIX hydrolase [Microvirgula aerodenitrificans]RAS17450.1 ADP-ribose pyrophosphatase [Microvirgula sp. AG722]